MVREFLGAYIAHGASTGILIASSGLTRTALSFAAKHRILVWTVSDFVEMSRAKRNRVEPIPFSPLGAGRLPNATYLASHLEFAANGSLGRLAALLLQRARQIGIGTCSGKPACAAEFGKQLKVDWLVLVSVSRVAGDRSLALELFHVAGKTIADRESLLLPKGTPLTREPLDAFAGRLKERLQGPPATADLPPEKKPADAPLNTALTPQVVADELPPLPPPEPKGHAVSWVLGGAGVAALAAGVVLLVVGASTQAQVMGTAGADGRVRSPLTGRQAQAAAGTASAEVGIGAALGAVGLGLGATAVVLW